MFYYNYNNIIIIILIIRIKIKKIKIIIIIIIIGLTKMYFVGVHGVGYMTITCSRAHITQFTSRS